MPLRGGLHHSIKIFIFSFFLLYCKTDKTDYKPAVVHGVIRLHSMLLRTSLFFSKSSVVSIGKVFHHNFYKNITRIVGKFIYIVLYNKDMYDLGITNTCISYIFCEI